MRRIRGADSALAFVYEDLKVLTLNLGMLLLVLATRQRRRSQIVKEGHQSGRVLLGWSFEPVAVGMDLPCSVHVGLSLTPNSSNTL